MILFAHRGARAHAPENTIEAFVLALELGATGLESDVWVTADGVAVLDHDGEASPGEPIAMVDRVDLPAHVPALAELYEAAGAGIDLSLDVKDPAAFGATLATARQAGAAERLWLCHHRWRQLGEWRSSAPEVKLVDSTYLGYMSKGPDGRADALAAAGVDAVNLHHSEWTAELVETFRARGLRCLAWDAQEPGAIDRMIALGVDGVFSDHVDRMVEAVGRVGGVLSVPACAPDRPRGSSRGGSRAGT